MIKRTLRALTLALATLPAIAMAQDITTEDLRTRAYAGQTADLLTTAAGLAAGASEANPLGIAIVPVKYGLLRYADAQTDPMIQRKLYRSLAASGYGPAANNICVVLVIITGGSGASGCLVLGALVWAADLNYTADEPVEGGAK